MGKRKKSEPRLGGITILPDGCIHIRVTVTLEGKRKEGEHTLPAGASIEDALKKKSELREALWTRLLDELLPPVPEEPPSRYPSLSSCAGDWLARKALKIKATTLEQYTILLGEHILPALASSPGGALGDRPVDTITRADLIAWRSELERKALGGVSIKTVTNRWSAGLRLMRDTWADLELPDPSNRLEGPAGRHKPRRTQETLSLEEVRRFVAAALKSRSGYGALLAVMAYTGMRRGEAIALRWEDVDLGARVLTVARSATWADKAWHIDTPKSGKPRRVGLSQELLQILQAWRGAMVRTQHRGLASGLVCPSPEGELASIRGVRLACERASKAAELDIEVTPQVLRRTYNSLALTSVDRVIVQAQLGHVDDVMTAHYLHLTDEALRRAADEVWK